MAEAVALPRPWCRPGVSASTNCPSGKVAMPSSRWRVVCGRLETMLTLAPTRALTSVDLPTLGRPMTATWPARWGVVLIGALYGSGELGQHGLGGLLLGGATGVTAAFGGDRRFGQGAGDVEGLVVVLAALGQQRVHRQRVLARLQPFLQPGLGVLAHLVQRRQRVEQGRVPGQHPG